MARILVVDDDGDIRPMLRMILSRLGHQAAMASRGQEGLSLALTGQFDLVVLDLMMPDIDGYDVTRRLRADPRTQQLPIIMLTARSQPADFQQAMEAGANAFVSKPFELEILKRHIEQLLGGPEAPGNGGEPDTPLAEVSVVLGLRGGIGATTSAVTLAGTLVRMGRRVCLVELSPSGGHIALHLRLNVATNWASLPREPDSSAVAKALARHESGLVALAAPAQPVRSGLPAETFQAALEALQPFFTDIVVDAAPLLDDASWTALSTAVRTIIVVSPEISAVHTAVGTLQTLSSLNRRNAAQQIALSYVTPEALLPATAIEKALGRAPDLIIPFDRSQSLALAHGTPLIFANPSASLPAAWMNYAVRVMEAVQG